MTDHADGEGACYPLGRRQMHPALRAAFDRLEAATDDETRTDGGEVFDAAWDEVLRVAREIDPDLADRLLPVREHSARHAAEAPVHGYDCDCCPRVLWGDEN